MNTTRSIRKTMLLGYTSIFMMVGGLGGWAYTAQLNGAVIAPATLVVESYSKKVQHPQGGLVSKILVKDGDRVAQGQDLILLDTTDAKTEVSVLTSALDELLVRRSRLEAMRDGNPDLVLPKDVVARAGQGDLPAIIQGQQKLLSSTLESDHAKSDQLNQQIEQLQEQIKGVGSQLVANATQYELTTQELNNLLTLQVKGLVPNSRVLDMKREVARLEGVKADLMATQASAKARIGEIKLRILQVAEDRRTQALSDLRDTEAKIAELSDKRISATAKFDRTSIKAPITGTIYQMMVHTEGGVIGAGDTLMLIVPEGDDLVLQAQVKPNDIDQVQQGQEARVRFTSFNSRFTPEVQAEVTNVAADVSRTDANSPPFYSVRLTISAKELSKLGDSKLKPGMSAEAFIQTNARTPLSYFVKPLVDQINHALREG